MSRQRFCPLCDRPFDDGEAVLRCEGCGVLHHPACWVRNEGCATVGEHRSSPLAEAYVGSGPAAGQAPHPGEGTRILNPARASMPPTQRLAAQREAPPRPIPFGDPIADDEDGPVIGDFDAEQSERQPVIGAPRARGQHTSGDEAPYRPTPPRRYQPQPDGAPPRKPLPRVYGRHRALDYWYVPVAVALAVVVAFGVIWAADQLLGGGGDDGDTDAAVGAPDAATTPGPGTAQTPSSSQTTPAGTPTTPAATEAGTFRPGDVVVVSGSGECLNVRPSPGLDNEPVACLPDGSEFEILAGPRVTEDLTWWQVQTAQGEGWAAEDYLVRRQ